MRREISRRFAIVSMLVVAVFAPPAQGVFDTGASRAQQIADAITELDLERAKQLLDKTTTDSPAIVFERARLAVYLGDCDTASAILSVPTFANRPESASLGDLAKRCAGAVAASKVIHDEANGLWIRLQNDEDESLVPLIADVANRSREAMRRDLGVDLPRPLRIDLVQDLFSLAAVTGLPLEAAETTGTVAVARWGRVTMISPRATPLGYPWEDTLAHEVVHLALSRATRDQAPLWLQEGIAKREETRWREARPFDNDPPPESVAKDALLTGQSVGINGLGMSIAMLETPQAASIAFAEVASFMNYWIEHNGDAGLRMFLADLKGVGREQVDAAMRSVTGYDLETWNSRWQKHLERWEPPAPKELEAEPVTDVTTDYRDVVRRVRLGEILLSRGHATAAAAQLEPTLEGGGRSPAIRYRVARALIDSDRLDDARALVQDAAEVDSLHGGWFALKGRFQREAGEIPAADASYRVGVSVDPLNVVVACGGYWPRAPAGDSAFTLPADPTRRALCETARKIPRD